MTRTLTVLLACLALAGCASQSVVQPRVVIPVECREKMPHRPAMPTESLPLDAQLDPFVQAALAEITLREGYEKELRAALQTCIEPIELVR